MCLNLAILPVATLLLPPNLSNVDLTGFCFELISHFQLLIYRYILTLLFSRLTEPEYRHLARQSTIITKKFLQLNSSSNFGNQVQVWFFPTNGRFLD